jgi:hypothetical protein
MMSSNRMAYMQARLQARHGNRPSEDRWRQLEATADVGGYLQMARNTSLRPWILQLPAEAGIHQIERSLRRDWRLYVAELASWATPDWRQGIGWMATLPDLPFLSHLARAEVAPAWLAEDQVLAAYALEEAGQRQDALLSGPHGGLVAAIAGGVTPIVAWLDAWAGTWPGEEGVGVAALERLRRLIAGHVTGILEDPLNHPRGPLLRRRLAGRLNREFRRESGRIAAVFAHLGLMLLDLERLQGGLALRALFPDPLRRPQWS